MLQIQPFSSVPLAPQPQVRKKIEHYSFNLNEKIGKGFSSVVYKGKNDNTNEIVAIKVIQLKSLKDQITKRLLQTELECIHKIQHNNLLKYVDSYETANNCYIVTEFCEGGDLEKQLRNKGKYSESEVMAIFRQFYLGYESFNNSGYIHRDIKPANIFIRQNVIKIADFGMVKKLTEHPKDSYNVGTPVYMSPQSIFNNTYSQKSDIWSMGIMLYQLTHGVLPWRGANEQELKASIQNNRICFDYNLISFEMIQFISKCLQKNSGERIGLKEMLSQPWMQRVMGTRDVLYNNIVTNQSVLDNQRNRKYSFKQLPVSGKAAVFAPRNQDVVNQSVDRSLRAVSVNKNVSLALLNPVFTVPTLQNVQKTQNSLNRINAKCERPTMDSQVKPKKKSSQNQNVQKKAPIDYLISILNYLRYLYKVHKIISTTKSTLMTETLKKTLKSALSSELLRCLEVQQKMVRNVQNVFGLQDWDQFIKGSKWSTFVVVVQQYSHKYQKLTSKVNKQNSPLFNGRLFQSLSLQLKFSIETLASIIRNNLPSQLNENQSQNVFELIQVIDYLITIKNLQEIVQKFGWILFVEKSTINVIVQSKYHVDSQNWKQVWERIQKITQVFYKKD